MARVADRLPENAPGDFFGDRSCIDCDLCRQIAPATFAGSDPRGQSYVTRQPDGEAACDRALRALVTCPNASIGTARKRDARSVSRAFPEVVEAEVGFCGYASANSHGASNWFVERARGNVMGAALAAAHDPTGGVHEASAALANRGRLTAPTPCATTQPLGVRTTDRGRG